MPTASRFPATPPRSAIPSMTASAPTRQASPSRTRSSSPTIAAASPPSATSSPTSCTWRRASTTISDRAKARLQGVLDRAPPGHGRIWRHARCPKLTKPDYHFATLKALRRRGGRALSGARRWHRPGPQWHRRTRCGRARRRRCGPFPCCRARSGRCRHHRRRLYRALRRASHRQERPRLSCSRPTVPAGAPAAAMAASSPPSSGCRSAASPRPTAAPWRRRMYEIAHRIDRDRRGTGSEFGITAAQLTRTGQVKAAHNQATLKAAIEEAEWLKREMGDHDVRILDAQRCARKPARRLRRRRAQSRLRRHPSAELSAWPRRRARGARHRDLSGKPGAAVGARTGASSSKRRKARCARGR